VCIIKSQKKNTELYQCYLLPFGSKAPNEHAIVMRNRLLIRDRMRQGHCGCLIFVGFSSHGACLVQSDGSDSRRSAAVAWRRQRIAAAVGDGNSQQRPAAASPNSARRQRDTSRLAALTYACVDCESS